MVVQKTTKKRQLQLVINRRNMTLQLFSYILNKFPLNEKKLNVSSHFQATCKNCLSFATWL